MLKHYKNKNYVALSHRGIGGLLREIITPARIRIPEIFEGFSHDYKDTKALWDTGATNCVISYRLAKELGLQPIGKAKTIGLHGEAIVDKFIVDILLMDQVAFNSWEVTSGKIGSEKVDVIIGMDILAFGDFCITQEIDQNKKVCTLFSFRLPSAQVPIDYVAEIQRHNREQQLKNQRKQLRAQNKSKRSKKRRRKW